jgi:hypothetical protein
VVKPGPRRLALKFNGSAGEYFRIWIVNIALTILTLGIYGAWAKVRTRRYFYSNTLLDGQPFDYTAKPGTILMGHLIIGGALILMNRCPIGKISKATLSETQTKEFIKLMEAVNNLENIGDIIETDLVSLGNKLIDEGVTISEMTQEILRGIHATVSKSVAAAVQAVSQGSELAAQSVTDMKEDINRQTDTAALHEAKRLVAEEPNRIPAYTIEMDIIEKLKRIYYFAKRMAKTVTSELPQEKSA